MPSNWQTSYTMDQDVIVSKIKPEIAANCDILKIASSFDIFCFFFVYA